jgi:hypothetical protein
MIRKIKQQGEFKHDHLFDVDRIQNVCLQNGYEADLQDCADVWHDYSTTSAAGWLNLPDYDDDLWQIIQFRVEEKSV